MNKSYVTNTLAVSAVLVGYFSAQPLLFSIGIFALSGAMTNLLAIHMLFEKVPFLYGSGVIKLKFKEFKASIRELVLEEFFSQEKVSMLLEKQQNAIDLTPVIKKVDLSPAFDKLVQVIEASQFGAMLNMFGGNEALQPMKGSFVDKMQDALIEITEEEKFKKLMSDELSRGHSAEMVFTTIENAVEQRLEELTPDMVKDIVQNMIKTHLGWLVVWGGVFGGLFGLLAAIVG
ncbi:hypothetical protein PSECIP111951_02530 [Pseudoalteromonas holothuriae]|uniref:DUF445 domain-containing protein n=1 Tax=Pseudoalteromonas holothuriae TaxID=2963714 RepID=A0A9W4VXK0_9GAMM|nr:MULTISPECIES: DUF445 domain-containing protein [unclassified Pseudoalteromonas]CAH9061638.1 hypothetical protein PSECIP111951_02530 [Pseudoalteromonas sp. CIP111951]CAH9061926.1 hypothetical protein PSECIP111854_02910 [Pseudoalteromonas sp. CIP111854]